MAVTFIGTGAQATEGDNSGTSVTVNFASHLAGDLLIAFINCSNGTPNLNPSATINALAGWTEIADISNGGATATGLYLAYHIATSDDEILTETFTSSVSTGYVSSGSVFRGADQTTPIDVSALGTAQALALSNTTPAVTTTMDDVFVVRALSIDDNNASGTTPSPSGYVLRFTHQESGPGNGVTAFWYDMIEPTAGDTGTEVISWTVDSEESISAVFGIRPAPPSETFTVDARILQTQTDTFTIDARVGVFIKEFTVDSILKATITKTFTVDARVKALDQEETFTIDSSLVRNEKFTMDAFVQALGDNGSCGSTIQRGTVSFTGTSTDVTLPNAVVLANSFLIFQYNVDNNAVAQVLVRGQLTSSTNIHFERTTGGATVNLSWYVTESSFISAQRGSFVFSTTTENQTITSVDTTESFSLASWEVAGSSWGDGDTIRHRLTSATNLEFLIDVLPGGFEPTVDWEVVQYMGATVQRGIVNMSDDDKVENVTITSVDSNRTIVHISNTISGAIAIEPDVQGLTGTLTSSTNLRIERNEDEENKSMKIAWEVTEFPADVKVQSGSESLGTSQTVANVAITSVDLNRTAVLISHDMKGGRSNDSSDDNPHTVWYKAELTTSTNLQLTRASSDSSDGNVTWYIIELPSVGMQQECFEVDARLSALEEFTVDAILVVQTKDFTVDAIIVRNELFTVDAFLQATQTETFTVDAILKATFTFDFTVDSVLQAEQVFNFIIDGLIQASTGKIFLVDGLVQDTFTVTVNNIDAIVSNPSPDKAEPDWRLVIDESTLEVTGDVKEPTGFNTYTQVQNEEIMGFIEWFVNNNTQLDDIFEDLNVDKDTLWKIYQRFKQGGYGADPLGELEEAMEFLYRLYIEVDFPTEFSDDLDFDTRKFHEDFRPGD